MLKGVLHPSKGNILFKDVLKECSDLAPKPLLWNIVDNNEERGKMISASMIGSCPRKSYLELNNDFYVPLADLYWASFRGSLRHLALERYAEHHKDIQIEDRYYAKIGGIEISGKIDAYEPKEKRLLDWKTCKFITPKYLPYGEHILQVNIYKYILEQNGIKVKDIDIVYLDGSGWAEVMFNAKKGIIRYIQKGQKTLIDSEARIFSEEELLRQVEPRIKTLHKAYFEDVLPPAEPSFLCNLENREKKSYCNVRHLCSYWENE